MGKRAMAGSISQLQSLICLLPLHSLHSLFTPCSTHPLACFLVLLSCCLAFHGLCVRTLNRCAPQCMSRTQNRPKHAVDQPKKTKHQKKKKKKKEREKKTNTKTNQERRKRIHSLAKESKSGHHTNKRRRLAALLTRCCHTEHTKRHRGLGTQPQPWQAYQSLSSFCLRLFSKRLLDKTKTRLIPQKQ